MMYLLFRSTLPVWEEIVVFFENFNYIVQEEPRVLMFFEVSISWIIRCSCTFVSEFCARLYTSSLSVAVGFREHEKCEQEVQHGEAARGLAQDRLGVPQSENGLHFQPNKTDKSSSNFERLQWAL